LALTGPTIGWVAAAADCCEGFTQPAAFAHLRIPILVLTAQQELLVDNASHDAVAALLPDCTHVTLAGAKHEILMERDDIRAQFWAAFDELLQRVPQRATA
jgi:lysophospholipase